MELGNLTGSREVSFVFTDKGSRVLEKIQHLFSDTNDAFRMIIDGSCCVIPLFLLCILKESQPSVPQLEITVLF